MSRSYKKNPYVTDGYGGDRNQHKKMTESWDICDYKWRMTREQAIEWYKYYSHYSASSYFKKRYPTLKAWLKYWEKCYVRK